ncbi:MAG: tetratricopeptide repeat protein [Candidatus Omnitrophica bacterium]|nr:tetratricopeptide repeat protein [Candidatus Omnitrophota bacterium]
MAPLASALPSQEISSADQQVRAYFAEGHQRQHEKRYAEAITAYRRALKVDPDQPETLNNIGFCYKELKDYKNAVRYYKDALRLNPKLAEAHEYLGEAYVQMGRLELAEQSYLTLLALDPEEAEELKEKIDAVKTSSTQSSRNSKHQIPNPK